MTVGTQTGSDAAAVEVGRRSAAVAQVPLRRRPLLVVVSVAVLLLGALLAVWLWTSASRTVEVLAARATIPRGSVIAAADVVAVQVRVDPSMKTIPASQLASVVGSRAALDVAAGSLLTPDEVAPVTVPGANMTVVGLALGRGMLPALPLQAGDAVRVVQTPGAGGQVVEGAAPLTVSAVVVSVTMTADGQSVLVDLLVPSDKAADLAARAATGKVALVLDSRER